MSVHAGSILHVAGRSVIDRIQSAGLGDVRVPIEVIREVGNREVVDKVPGEPDFTFSLESLDVSTELEAILTGDAGVVSFGSASGAGFDDANGTEYKWDETEFISVVSPWKDPATASAGTIQAGHLIPAYFPTRIRYRFGITENATQEVELAGGSFYYAGGGRTPVEEFFTGDGADTTFVSADNAVRHRKGGPTGTEFRSAFGVIVDGILQIENVDYTLSGGNNSPVTVTFTTAPVNNADIRFSYFTTAAKSFPQTVHASTITKPGAIRGRDIEVRLGSGLEKAASVQAIELEATVDTEVERELGNDEIVGRVINGRDCNGTLTVRSKDAAAFISLLGKVTGHSQAEVFGFFNQEEIPLEIRLKNPKDGTVLKTLYVSDAQFQPPGTPARVNTATDFAFRFESKAGTYSAFKGSRP